MAHKINLDKHIWEGWRVRDFIEELEPDVERVTSTAKEFYTNGGYAFKNKAEMKKWIVDNQPYYKKYIPDVFWYFYDKYGVAEK